MTVLAVVGITVLAVVLVFIDRVDNAEMRGKFRDRLIQKVAVSITAVGGIAQCFTHKAVLFAAREILGYGFISRVDETDSNREFSLVWLETASSVARTRLVIMDA